MGSYPDLYLKHFGHEKTQMTKNEFNIEISGADGFNKETESF